MKVFIASDHGGYEAKKHLVEALDDEYEIVDLGPEKLDPNDDYPIYAKKVADNINSDKSGMGILLCRSGEGMEIAANKIDGIRAVVAWNSEIAKQSRRDNDSNVLSLPADKLTSEQIINISRAWLETDFSNQARHIRRLEQIKDIESNN